MNTRLISKFIPLALFAVPALSLADTLHFVGADLGNDYDLTYNHQTLDVFVGSLTFTLDNSKTKFQTFCVDLNHVITPGQSYAVDVLNTLGLSNSSVYRLAGDIYDDGIKTATDANHSAALQIAIWTEVYGNKFSLKGVSSTVQSEANSYLTNGLKFKGAANYYEETANCGQSQIGPVPEPSTFAVLGIGGFGLLLRRKRS